MVVDHAQSVSVIASQYTGLLVPNWAHEFLCGTMYLEASALCCFRGHLRFLTLLRTIFAEERESKNETDAAALEVCIYGSFALVFSLRLCGASIVSILFLTR